MHESYESNDDKLRQIGEDSLDLIKKSNKPTKGEKSLFVLDGLLTSLSVHSDLESERSVLMDVVEEMTKICLEIGVVSNYVTQGRVMCALTLVSQNFKELEKDKTLTHEVMKQRACEEPI